MNSLNDVRFNSGKQSSEICSLLKLFPESTMRYAGILHEQSASNLSCGCQRSSKLVPGFLPKQHENGLKMGE